MTETVTKDELIQATLEQVTLDKKLSELKSIDLTDAEVKVWVANSRVKNKHKRFGDIQRLVFNDESKDKLLGYILQCIEGNEHLIQLKNTYTAQDNKFYFVETASTDLAQLTEIITQYENETVTDENQLNGYNSYVIQLTYFSHGEYKNLFAYRYIKGAWSLKNTSGKFLGFRKNANELIAQIEESYSFRIDSGIDFLIHDEDIFIADVRQFEVAMNYRERLKEKKTEAITALCSSPSMIESSKDALSKAVGNDKHLMRQLASVHEKGYYSNSSWLNKLKEASDTAGNWKIQFDSDGKIIVEESKEYVRELLTLLQNKRVRTVVDGEVFDVDGELIAIQ